MKRKLEDAGFTIGNIREGFEKLARHDEKIDTLMLAKNSHHEKFNEIHKSLGLIRMDTQSNNNQLQHVIEDMREMKDVIKNNTSAIHSFEKTQQVFQETLLKILTEKETTKANIAAFAKFTTWFGGIVAMGYAGFTAIKSWVK